MRRLDIDPEDVAAAPKVTEILSRCFGRNSDRFPRREVFNYLSSSNAPCAIEFLKSMRQIAPADLPYLSLEAMCVRARVNPLELLGAILVSAKQLKATESALKAILAHPDVVEATVDAAKQGDPVLVNGQTVLDKAGNIVRYKGDVAAQRLLHEAVGFLPSKKGGGIAINFGFGRPADDRDGDTDADSDWDDAFPDMGSEIQSLSEQKHKMLEAKK